MNPTRSEPVARTTSSTSSPTPSATPRPPTRSTTPATPCSSPSGASGALRPDPPPHPHNPPSGLIRAVAPSAATPLSSPPNAPPLSHRPRLSTRAEDRSGLAQVLRALQHPPSIHSLPNSAYDSFYLPPSGSSPYWKRLRAHSCRLVSIRYRFLRGVRTWGKGGRIAFHPIDIGVSWSALEKSTFPTTWCRFLVNGPLDGSVSDLHPMRPCPPLVPHHVRTMPLSVGVVV